MTIQCSQCNFSQFYVRDGAYFCEQCHLESAEHGAETVLDEASIGTFGSGASTLKRRKIGGRKKKQKRRGDDAEYLTTFTTTDMFSFVLKAWVNEMILLGSKSTLKQLAFTIWSKYLQSLGLAFSGQDREPGLSDFPTFRDLQVKLLGRKKVLNAAEVQRLRRKRSRPLPKKANSSSSDEDNVDSAKARKKRKKKRSSFFKSMANASYNGDDNTNDMSGVSFSSFASSSSFLSNLSLDTSCMSNVSGNDSSSDWDTTTVASSSKGEEVSAGEEDALREKHAQILERMTVPKRPTKADSRVLSLNSVVGCLALAVLCNEDNPFTLADLDYWIETGALSFRCAIKNVPPVMRLRGAEDIPRLAPPRSLYEFGQAGLRKVVFDLACRLDMREVDFNQYGTLQVVLTRYLKELSLPTKLLEAIFGTLVMCPGLLEVKQTFPNVAPCQQTYFHPMSSVDVRSLALILFALKNLFLLDDCSEEFISSSLRTMNLSTEQKSKKFVICDWIKASRWRLFLAVKHSPILNARFGHLCPEVDMTDAALMEKLEDLEDHLKELRLVGRPLTKTEQKMYNSVKDELMNHYPTPLERRSLLELTDSKTPLFHFARHCLKYPTEVFEDGDLGRKEMKALLKMRKAALGAWSDHSEAQQQVCPDVPWKLGCIRSERSKGGDGKKGTVEYCKETLPRAEEGKRYSLPLTYWRLRPERYTDFSRPRMFNSWQTQLELASVLPENFCWILEYVAAHSGLPPTEIYAELVLVEEIIFRQDRKYFGKVIKSKHVKLLHK